MQLGLSKKQIPTKTASPIALLLICGSCAFSNFLVTSANADDLFYGPEFTFSNEDMFSPDLNGASKSNSTEIFRYRGILLDIIAKKCEPYGCNPARVISEGNVVINNFVISVAQDPGVIEVQISKMSLKRWKQNAPLIQKILFDSAAEAGIRPYEFLGGGHITIGGPRITENPLLAYNFWVDYHNHPSLAMGALSHDPQNARSLAEVPTGSKLKVFLDYINTQGREYITSNTETPSFAELSTLFSAIPSIRPNDLRINQDSRFEIRAVRPQQSAFDFLTQITLFEARIEYLESIDKPLELLPPIAPKSTQEALEEYHRYITDVGLDWNDYKGFVLPWWTDEVETFDKHLESKNCSTTLLRLLRGLQ